MFKYIVLVLFQCHSVLWDLSEFLCTFFQIKNIRENIEDFVERNQEPNFEEDEFIYDELDLEDLGWFKSVAVIDSYFLYL